jgi:hypothetical protein
MGNIEAARDREALACGRCINGRVIRQKIAMINDKRINMIHAMATIEISWLNTLISCLVCPWICQISSFTLRLRRAVE